MPHTSFVTDQAFAMIRALGHHPPIVWAWTLDTNCIPQQQWHEDPIHDHTFDQLASIQHVLGHLARILAQNELRQLDAFVHDGPAPDGRRSILPGLVDCLPRRLQEATARDIFHRSPQEWPRAAKKELDLLYEYLRQQGLDPNAGTPGAPSGGHLEPAWLGSKPDALPRTCSSKARNGTHRSRAGRSRYLSARPCSRPSLPN